METNWNTKMTHYKHLEEQYLTWCQTHKTIPAHGNLISKIALYAITLEEIMAGRVTASRKPIDQLQQELSKLADQLQKLMRNNTVVRHVA